MELITSNATAIAALVGVAMLLIGQLAKCTGLEGKYVAAGMAVAVGILYTAFQKYVPADTQKNVVSFVGTAFTTSWALYELLWKPVRTKLNA